MSMKKEFEVNEYITLKLQEGKTNIYVKEKLFQQCKFLLVNIPLDEIRAFDEIQSIDEAVDTLDRSLERDQKETVLPPETEFWGHCSNMQVWAEHNYDTRLLHRSLAFPLLKELTEVGDSFAQQIFKEEIARRFLTGNKSVIIFLKDYLNYFSPEELIAIFDDVQFNKLLTKSLEDPSEQVNFGNPILIKFIELGVQKAQEPLGQIIKKAVISKNHSTILSLSKYFHYIPPEELNVILNNEDFLNDIQNSFQDFQQAKSFVIPVLVKFINLDVLKAKEILIGLLEKVHVSVFQYFLHLSTVLKKHPNLLSVKDIHEILYNNDNNIRENLRGGDEDISSVYPILDISAEKGDSISVTNLKSSIQKRFKHDLENMIHHLNDHKHHLKYLIPLEELRAIKLLDNFSRKRLKLVKPFPDSLKKKDYKREVIPDWDYYDPFQFYINDDHVEGIAIMITNNCDDCLKIDQNLKECAEALPGNSEICKDCGFYEIPSYLASFQELKKLCVFVSSVFRLEYIPPGLKNLKSLETLFLYACGSNNLSKFLSGFSSLKSLIINKTQVHQLPPSIGFLINLEYLNLGSCHLKTLPKTIGNLTNLRSLILDNNPITHLPESLRELRNLQVFSLKKDSFTRSRSLQKYNLNEFPEVLCRITSLKELYLENNQIKNIPSCLGDLTNLTALSFNNTQIVNLPTSIGLLRNLKSLTLENCKISSFPETLTNLKSLKTLNIEGNILFNLSEKVTNFLFELKAIAKK